MFISKIIKEFNNYPPPPQKKIIIIIKGKRFHYEFEIWTTKDFPNARIHVLNP